jgi:hypothetical protein
MLRDVDAARAIRIRSQVETRARTCETWLPLWRALNANQGESAGLKTRIRLARDMITKRLEIMYRRELETLSERERRQTLIALEAITDFESWGACARCSRCRSSRLRRSGSAHRPAVAATPET